jgi:hypothetical protein
MNAHGEERLEKRRQLANAHEQARFEAARAHRQYDQVDPDNRLVASELERRWNERLASVHALEEQLTQHDTGPAIVLGLEDRERLLALGRDLSRAWDSAAAGVETRKKIVRLLIVEIIVDVMSDKLELVIHWHGDDHTRLSLKRNKIGQNHWMTDADVVDLVRILARQMPDESIAAILNRAGKSTGRGNSWTRSRVCTLRYGQNIAPYREGERAERGEVTINEAGSALAVSPSTIQRMINDGTLPAQHLCKGAPWIIRLSDLNAAAQRYHTLLAGSGVPTPEAMSYARHVYHIYAIRSDHRQQWHEVLQAQGIQTGIHYPIPVHLLPAFADLGYTAGRFPHSEQAANEVLSLPMFAELSAEQCEVVAHAVRSLASKGLTTRVQVSAI